MEKLISLSGLCWWSILLVVLIQPGLPVLASDEDCNEPLILPDNVNLTSTSSRSPVAKYGPQQALLHNTKAWCANLTNTDQYLEIDLGLVVMIQSLAIQGNPDTDEFVKTFSVSYAVLDDQWLTYTEHGARHIFGGNSNSGSVTTQVLKNILAARYVRIIPETWFGHVCVRFQMYGCDATPFRALGMTSAEIRNNAITSSSYYWDKYCRLGSYLGRLYWTLYKGCHTWAAAANVANQWLQIDLSRLKFVTAIATQGRHLGGNYVKSYWLSHSTDGTMWKEFQENQSRKTFTGNSDGDTVVRHQLFPVIYARFVRFNVITWYGHIAMRCEVYSFGRASPADLALDSNEVPNSRFTASSSHNSLHAPHMSRLNNQLGACAWCSSSSTNGQWLKIDLGHTMLVTGIVTQSRGNGIYNWITQYKLSHSLDNNNWEFYKDDQHGSVAKTFKGNSNLLGYVTNTFNRDIKTRFIKIHPTGWNGWICLRTSILGRRKGALGSPVFTNQDNSNYITVYKNHDVTLKCEAVGDTPITATWVHKGQVLQSGTSPIDLTLFKVKPSQQGFYNCTAANTRGSDTKMLYLQVKGSFELCSKYLSRFDTSRLKSASTSTYINDDNKLNESTWYIFKDKQGFYRIPTSCVPQNRCGAMAPGYMQGALPTVSEGIVKRKVCFHSNGNCCQYSVDIHVLNCYLFYTYNLKKLDLSWKARYCAEDYINDNPNRMFNIHKQLSLVVSSVHIANRLYKVPDGETCTRYCLLENTCKSFSHNPVFAICELYNVTSDQFTKYGGDRRGYQYFEEFKMIT